MKNRKGLVDQIYIVIILFIVFLVLIGGFWLVATAGPLIVGESKQLNNIIRTSVNTNSPNTSIANATTVATNTADSFLSVTEFLVYISFFGLLVGYVVVCFYVRTFKWLAFIWVGLMIAVIFICFIVSNSYQQASNSSSDINGFYAQWGMNNYLMLCLPYIAGVFGIVSGVILFAIISTDSEEETRYIS